MFFSPKESDKKIIQSQIVSFYFKLFESLKDNQHIQKSMDTIKEDLFVKFFNSSSNKLNDFVKLTQIPVRLCQCFLWFQGRAFNSQEVEISCLKAVKAMKLLVESLLNPTVLISSQDHLENHRH